MQQSHPHSSRDKWCIMLNIYLTLIVRNYIGKPEVQSKQFQYLCHIISGERYRFLHGIMQCKIVESVASEEEGNHRSKILESGLIAQRTNYSKADRILRRRRIVNCFCNFVNDALSFIDHGDYCSLHLGFIIRYEKG